MMKDRIIKQGGRAASHARYTTSNGKRVPGGSSLARVVNLMGGDGLLRWAVNQAETCHDCSGTGIVKYCMAEVHGDQPFETPGVDFVAYRNEAADFGKCFHRAVETEFKGIRFEEELYPGIYVEPAKVMAANYFAKLKELGLVMVGSEIAHTSDAERAGGTMDLILAEAATPTVAEILGDLKSSNSVGPEHVIQVGGVYSLLFDEKFAPCRRVILFRADRTSFRVSHHELPADLIADARKAARLARQLWDLKPSITRKF